VTTSAPAPGTPAIPVEATAVGYGGTISADAIDHLIGQQPVDPAAAAALRTLHDDLGLRIILATNATASETRWPALQAADVHDLFAVALISYSLNVRKDDPLFYELVITAARCPAEQVLFVGEHSPALDQERPHRRHAAPGGCARASRADVRGRCLHHD
jgi:hypothetical protein